MTDVIKIIRDERKRRGLALEVVAYAAQINASTLCMYEKYKHSPKFEVVESMLDFLGYEIVIRKKGERS